MTKDPEVTNKLNFQLPIKLENKEGLAKAHGVGIKTIPTMIFYQNEKELKRIVGLPKEDQLKKDFLELNP